MDFFLINYYLSNYQYYYTGNFVEKIHIDIIIIYQYNYVISKAVSTILNVNLIAKYTMLSIQLFLCFIELFSFTGFVK